MILWNDTQYLLSLIHSSYEDLSLNIFPPPSLNITRYVSLISSTRPTLVSVDILNAIMMTGYSDLISKEPTFFLNDGVGFLTNPPAISSGSFLKSVCVTTPFLSPIRVEYPAMFLTLPSESDGLLKP